jgi:hypothetical protein
VRRGCNARQPERAAAGNWQILMRLPGHATSLSASASASACSARRKLSWNWPTRPNVPSLSTGPILWGLFYDKIGRSSCNLSLIETRGG